MKKLLETLKKLFGKSSSEKGFTLIELLVVIGILGVLAVGALVALNPVGQFNRTKDATAKQNVDQAASAIQAYYAANQAYPADWAALTTSGDLKQIPVGPDGTTNATYVAPTAGDTTPNAAVWFTEKAGATSTSVWCWQSSTGKAQEFAASTSCTAP